MVCSLVGPLLLTIFVAVVETVRVRPVGVQVTLVVCRVSLPAEREQFLSPNQQTRDLISAPQRKGRSLPLVEFRYLVFTRMPGESYRKRLVDLC